jgi:hypothetical protein
VVGVARVARFSNSIVPCLPAKTTLRIAAPAVHACSHARECARPPPSQLSSKALTGGTATALTRAIEHWAQVHPRPMHILLRAAHLHVSDHAAPDARAGRSAEQLLPPGALLVRPVLHPRQPSSALYMLCKVQREKASAGGLKSANLAGGRGN